MNKRVSITYNLIYFFCALIAFVLLAYQLVHHRLDEFNQIIYDQIAPMITPVLTKEMALLSNMGAWYVYASIALILVVLFKTRYRYGIPASIMLITTALLNEGVKHYFAIPRPTLHRLVEASGFGFPSGHSMSSMAFVSFLVFLVCFNRPKQSIAHSLMKLILIVFSLLFIGGIGFSRIYLGVHNPTDVIGGYLLGIVLVNIGAMMMKS